MRSKSASEGLNGRRDRSRFGRGFSAAFASRCAQALEHRDDIIRALTLSSKASTRGSAPVAPAFTHRKPGSPVEMDDLQISYFLAVGGYTTPFNVSGHPAVVLPAGGSTEGLPIGVQVVGHRYLSGAVPSRFAKTDRDLTCEASRGGGVRVGHGGVRARRAHEGVEFVS